MLQSIEKWNCPVKSSNWLSQIRSRGTGLSTGERREEGRKYDIISSRLILSVGGLYSGLYQ